MRRCQTALLLMLAATPAGAQPTPTAPIGAGDAAGRILVVPSLQWDHAMVNFRPTRPQSAADFTSLTGGIAFGMAPTAVSARLPHPVAQPSWTDLPPAKEYAEEVRYFAVPLAAAGRLVDDIAACRGDASDLVFLFTERGLFRLSYRLRAAPGCADPAAAARALLGRYVPLDPTVALSTRYRTEETEVVDVTDPATSFLVPTRRPEGAE